MSELDFNENYIKKEINWMEARFEYESDREANRAIGLMGFLSCAASLPFMGEAFRPFGVVGIAVGTGFLVGAVTKGFYDRIQFEELEKTLGQ